MLTLDYLCLKEKTSSVKKLINLLKSFQFAIYLSSRSQSDIDIIITLFDRRKNLIISIIGFSLVSGVGTELAQKEINTVFPIGGIVLNTFGCPNGAFLVVRVHSDRE